MADDKRYVDNGDGSYKDLHLGTDNIRPGNWQWEGVQTWLAKGNVPIAPKPGSAYVLDEKGDWVLDAALDRELKKRDAKSILANQTVELARAIVAIRDVLVQKGLLAGNDLPEDVRQDLAAWRLALDALKE